MVIKYIIAKKISMLKIEKAKSAKIPLRVKKKKINNTEMIQIKRKSKYIYEIVLKIFLFSATL